MCQSIITFRAADSKLSRVPPSLINRQIDLSYSEYQRREIQGTLANIFNFSFATENFVQQRIYNMRQPRDFSLEFHSCHFEGLRRQTGSRKGSECLFFHAMWLVQKKTKVTTSQKLFSSSVSQTVFFGGEKTVGNIRLRSKATNRITTRRLMSSHPIIVGLTYLATQSKNRGFYVFLMEKLVNRSFLPLPCLVLSLCVRFSLCIFGSFQGGDDFIQ